MYIDRPRYYRINTVHNLSDIFLFGTLQTNLTLKIFFAKNTLRNCAKKLRIDYKFASDGILLLANTLHAGYINAEKLNWKLN